MYTGLIGSGKTLLAVKRISYYISCKRMVITDIPLLPAFYEFHKKRGLDTDQLVKIINPGEILDIPEKYIIMGEDESKSVVVVLDESAEFLDSYDQAAGNKKMRDFMSFLRLSRHYKMDVEFLVQDSALLQRRVRLLCHEIYHHTNMSKFTIPVIGRLPPPWRYMVVTSKWDRNEKMRLASNQWEFLKSEAMNWYETTHLYHGNNKEYKQFLYKEEKEDGQEMKKQDRLLIFAFFAGMFILVLVNTIIQNKSFSRKVRMFENELNEIVIPVEASENAIISNDEINNNKNIELIDTGPQVENKIIEPEIVFYNFGTLEEDGKLRAVMGVPYDIIDVGSMIKEGFVREIKKNFMVINKWDGKILILTNVEGKENFGNITQYSNAVFTNEDIITQNN